MMMVCASPRPDLYPVAVGAQLAGIGLLARRRLPDLSERFVTVTSEGHARSFRVVDPEDGDRLALFFEDSRRLEDRPRREILEGMRRALPPARIRKPAEGKRVFLAVTAEGGAAEFCRIQAIVLPSGWLQLRAEFGPGFNPEVKSCIRNYLAAARLWRGSHRTLVAMLRDLIRSFAARGEARFFRGKLARTRWQVLCRSGILERSGQKLRVRLS